MTFAIVDRIFSRTGRRGFSTAGDRIYVLRDDLYPTLAIPHLKPPTRAVTATALNR